MRHAIFVLLFVTALPIVAAPVLPTPSGPSPEALKAITDRRKNMDEFRYQRRSDMSPADRAAFDLRTVKQFDELKAALAHEDAYIVLEAIRDLGNRDYQAFAVGLTHTLLLPHVRTVATNPVRIDVQMNAMQLLLTSEDRTIAKEAFPLVLAHITNEKASSSIRSRTVTLVGRFAGNDPETLTTFRTALTQPDLRDWSFHTYIIEELGKMGPTARPAVKELLVVYDRGPRYQYVTLQALGVILRPDKPAPLQTYLDQLDALDKHTLETKAVAFAQVNIAATTQKHRLIGSPTMYWEVHDSDAAAVARPVLLKLATRRDVFGGAALQVLTITGPGSSKEAAEMLATRLVQYREGLSVAEKVIAAAPQGPERFARSADFNKILSSEDETLLTNVLARLELTTPAARQPIFDAFAKLSKRRGDWHLADLLARKISTLGKDAQPALTDTLRAMRELVLDKERNALHEMFVHYAGILAAVGHEDARVAPALNEFLDPKQHPMKSVSPATVAYLQVHLLLALADVGFVEKERATALQHVQTALASDIPAVFSAACVVVSKHPTRTAKEAAPIVQSLRHALTDADAFLKPPAEPPRAIDWAFTHEERNILGRGMALRTLAALGPLAADALPDVQKIAALKIEKRGDFEREPTENFVIREAQKTLAVLTKKR